MSTPQSSPRFVRRTHLGAGEYRRNFRQIDDEIINTVSSPEADLVTPLMSKIYLRLITSPPVYWEHEGVLRFAVRTDGTGKSPNAWVLLCELLGVASATARKALSWMHDVGVIGYFAGKNGVGIRIFINRATSSIGNRQPPNGKKILRFYPTSFDAAPASPNEAPFNDSFAVLEKLDIGNTFTAPNSGADEIVAHLVENEASLATIRQVDSIKDGEREISVPHQANYTISPTDQMIHRLKNELELSLQRSARQAASREHERTREWLEKSGIPKAARVAQREAYNVLRKCGMINHENSGRSASEVGRTYYSPQAEQRLSPLEVEELAGACLAMLETKGQLIDTTLFDLSAEEGGFLQPEDACLVRKRANCLLARSLESE